MVGEKGIQKPQPYNVFGSRNRFKIVAKKTNMKSKKRNGEKIGKNVHTHWEA